MADSLNEVIDQVLAGEDLYQNDMRLKVVTWAGTIAQDNKNVMGVLKFNAQSGYPAGVVVAGGTKARITSTVNTIGWALKATTSGWLTAAASGDQVCARLRDATCASGDIVNIVMLLGGMNYKAQT